ncbi:T9SS type A sorting domain-containing protein [Pseudoflavitalea rhizosphaerae]|uniref:T9SS type A sorting domain-containing protein n=1 Tax=Pseudoflavitalea rhizosphaerae TaxID=1884793 RepID=UPI000F8E10E6|nr:T9SS type A sorting domain-containing protein [Pseudoflavitalea rhizosphaerae]
MKMKPTLNLLILLLGCLLAEAQPFWKTYPVPNRPQQLKDIVEAGNNGYAFIRDHSFVLVNKNGALQKEWVPAAFADLPFEKLIRTSTGKFVISANSIGLPGFWLFILSENAEQEKVYQYQFDEKVRAVKILPAANGNFFLTYVKEIEEKPERLQVLYLDGTGQKIWQTEIPEGVFFNYALQPSVNGGLDIAYTTPGERKLKVANITATNQRSEKQFSTLFMDGEMYLPSFFCKSPDGGYLFAATEAVFGMLDNSDLLFMKADADGKTMWTKLADISMNDEMAGFQHDANGYIVLSASGWNANWYDLEGSSDLVLSRFNWQGELQWKKAFGTAGNNEYANALLLTSDAILAGGWARYFGQPDAAPLLIKTNLKGELNDAVFPYSIQPAASLKNIQVPLATRTQEIIHTLALPGGGYIATAKLIGVTEEDYMACLIKINAAGEFEWVKMLSDITSSPGRICAASDGNFLVLLTEYDTGVSIEQVLKLRPDGAVIWRSDIWARHVDDIAASNDGGCYISGAETDGMVQFNVFIMKLNANGSEAWRKPRVFFRYNTRASKICVTPDQKLVVTGEATRTDGTGLPGIYLSQSTLDGDGLWARVYVRTDTVMAAQSLLATTDLHYLVAGYAESTLSGNRDALLMKVDRTGATTWAKTFDIHLTDNSNSLLERGDTAYCLAGTTGEPVFGTRKKYGFLANIRKDGTKNVIRYFGNGDPEFSVNKLFDASGGRLHFIGNREEQYGNSSIYFGTLDPLVLSGNEVDLNNGIKLFPNPAKGTSWLELNNSFAGEIRILVTGISGLPIKTVIMKKHTGSLVIPLNLKQVPAGVYQVVVWMGTKKVVKQLLVIP